VPLKDFERGAEQTFWRGLRDLLPVWDSLIADSTGGPGWFEAHRLDARLRGLRVGGALAARNCATRSAAPRPGAATPTNVVARKLDSFRVEFRRGDDPKSVHPATGRCPTPGTRNGAAA